MISRPESEGSTMMELRMQLNAFIFRQLHGSDGDIILLQTGCKKNSKLQNVPAGSAEITRKTAIIVKNRPSIV